VPSARSAYLIATYVKPGDTRLARFFRAMFPKCSFGVPKVLPKGQEEVKTPITDWSRFEICTTLGDFAILLAPMTGNGSFSGSKSNAVQLSTHLGSTREAMACSTNRAGDWSRNSCPPSLLARQSQLGHRLARQDCLVATRKEISRQPR
jgi:hypothetical protein